MGLLPFRRYRPRPRDHHHPPADGTAIILPQLTVHLAFLLRRWQPSSRRPRRPPRHGEAAGAPVCIRAPEPFVWYSHSEPEHAHGPKRACREDPCPGARRVTRLLPPSADMPAALASAALVESRMGAVAWAMRQRSVSHPRSSNRTCGFPASGSPTGFVVRHTEKITDRKRHRAA